MKGFDRINVKSAVKSVKSFDLSQSHLTTLEFGEPVPLYVKELIPRDKFSVKANFFTRLAPLVKPVYGRCSFRTASFFIPSFQVCDEADAFLNNMRAWKGSSTSLRYITYFQYVSFLTSAIGLSVTLATGEHDGNDGYIYNSNNERVKKYDYKYIDSSGVTSFRVYTDAYSKYCLKLLFSLGYSFPTGVDLRTSSTWYTGIGVTLLNAMPILAFMKAFNDWMSQSSRYNGSQVTEVIHKIRHNVDVSSYYVASSHTITAACLGLFFSNLRVAYESDYFTTAWQSPNALLGQSDTTTQFDVTAGNPGANTDKTIDNNQNNVYVATISNGLSSFVLDFVQSAAAYVRRNTYSGSREVEKMLSRFGIKSEDFKSNYAHLIDTSIHPVQVGDVTAQAQTYGSTPSKDIDLGDYAGKGISQANVDFNFESKDYGYLIVIGWFTVNPMYPFGFNRQVLRTKAQDFYQPEFDGIGPEAISAGEVNTNPIAATTDTYKNDNAVFGYTERYNDYRFGRDLVTGDFRDQHEDGDMNCWHFARNLNTIRSAGQLVAQSSNMNTMQIGGTQFNRVFSVTDSSVDHFYMSAQFSVRAQRPMLNLNQVPRLGEGNTSVARNGNEVN